MKLPAKRELAFFLLITLSISTTVFLYITVRFDQLGKLKQKQQEATRVLPNLDTNAQRKLDDSAFTKTSYVVPLERNASGSAYSSRAQVRGTVKRWGTETLIITMSTQEMKDIKLSPFIRLYCTPKYFVDNRGNQVLASTVWVNVPSPETVGTLTPLADVTKKFPTGSDILVYVNVDNRDAMTANLIVGYGCRGEK